MRIQIWRNQVYQSDYDFSKPIEFGRQKIGEPNPIAFVENHDSVRCIVTSHTENTVSRNQLRVEVLGFKLVLTNLNQQRQFELNGLPDLEAGASLSVDMYSEIGFLDLGIRIVQDVSCQSLPNQTLGPGQLSGVQRNAMQSFHSLDDKPLGDTHLSQAKLLHWLTTAMVVFQEAANSPKFLPRAADAVREIVNLSTASVLLKDDGQWKSHAVSTDGPIDDAWSPSSTILSLIEREKKTFFNQASIHYSTHTTKCIKVFSNGRLHITGVTSIIEAANVCEFTCKLLNKTLGAVKGNEKVEAIDLQLCMINTNFSLNHGIDIIELKKQFQKYEKFTCFYTPDTYPGLKIKYLHDSSDKSSIFIFSSGQIVITGVKHIVDVNTVYTSLMNIMIECHTEIYNPYIQIKAKKKKNKTYKFGYDTSIIKPCLEI